MPRRILSACEYSTRANRIPATMLRRRPMDSNVNHVSDLIFGRWRSQVLYAGVELGVFDHLHLDAPNPRILPTA